MFPHMKTATARASGWAIPGWTVEIAFPLRPSQGVGGLLSAGHGTYIENADPNAGAKWLSKLLQTGLVTCWVRNVVHCYFYFHLLKNMPLF